MTWGGVDVTQGAEAPSQTPPQNTFLGSFSELFGTFVFSSLEMVTKTRPLERGLESRAKKKKMFGPPRTLSGGLAHARQLNSHLFVVAPPASIF